MFQFLAAIGRLYDDYNRDRIPEVFYDLFQIRCKWDWDRCDAAEHRIARTGVVEPIEFVAEFKVEPTVEGLLLLTEGVIPFA